jgi:cation transport regulator
MLPMSWPSRPDIGSPVVGVRFVMPYTTNDELPASVGNHLPPHAQDIFREAFNHAWQQHRGDEATAFRIAWAAVKRRYRKAGETWVAIDRGR